MKQRGQWLPRIALFLMGAAIITVSIVQGANVRAANFSLRSLDISSSIAGETGVEYTLKFAGQSPGTVGSVRLQICSNDPFPGFPCTPAPGVDLSQAQIVSQSGMTGFSVHPSTTWSELVLTRTPGATTTGLVSIRFDHVSNPALVGTIFGRLETFATIDATGPSHDAGGIAIAMLPKAVSVQTTVPPYLSFCIGVTIQPYDCATASGNYIDFGELSSTRTATGQTKLLVSTNAEFGYTIRALGTTLTSGINVVSAMTSPDVSRVGTNQFGLNLRANGTPSTGQDPAGAGLGQPAAGYNAPNTYKFVPGEVLASYNHPDDHRMYTVTYIANIGKNQPPGVYVTTLTYVALASF